MVAIIAACDRDGCLHYDQEIVMGDTRRIPDPVAEPTITVPRAAAVLGCGLRTAYDAVDRGELPAIRIGRAIRVPTARFLAQYGLLADQHDGSTR